MGKRTVLITGTSSGIGKATALLFWERGWNVIATMRNPEKRKTDLHGKKGIDLVHLDVTDQKSISRAIAYTKKKYKKLDVLVNNAGYALFGPFEASTPEQARRQLDTNVLGLMDITREAVPIMRKQKGGTVINLASVGGRIGFPYYAVYNASKFAVEGFSEALHQELKPFNIRIKLIEPGVINTDFYDRSLEPVRMTAYDRDMEKTAKGMNNSVLGSLQPDAVAKTIYSAATDKSWRLRYSVGRDAKVLLTMRKLSPDSLFLWFLRESISK